MNIERFKSNVVAGIAAKTGITREQAGVILDNVVKLPSADIEKKLNFSELEVRLTNQKVSVRPDIGRVKIFDCPYETVAKFNVGQDSHEITFLGLDRAAAEPAGQIELVEQGDRLIVLGGLEGDPDVDPLEGDSDVSPPKRSDFVALEGDQDTDPREEIG